MHWIDIYVVLLEVFLDTLTTFWIFDRTLCMKNWRKLDAFIKKDTVGRDPDGSALKRLIYLNTIGTEPTRLPSMKTVTTKINSIWTTLLGSQSFMKTWVSISYESFFVTFDELVQLSKQAQSMWLCNKSPKHSLDSLGSCCTIASKWWLDLAISI